MNLDFLTTYGPDADRTSLPLGGLGAGMMMFNHYGSLEAVSIQHHPEMYNDPVIFASLYNVQSKTARVIQGDIAPYKVIQAHGVGHDSSASGRGNQFGLPHYSESSYRAGFPFAELALSNPEEAVTCTTTAWSPFIPGDDHHSGLPCGILEYTLHNTGDEAQELVFSFHSEHFVAGHAGHTKHAKTVDRGFVLESVVDIKDPSAEEQQECCGPCDCGPSTGKQKRSSLAASLLGADQCVVDCGWFRSGWFDKRTALWDDIRGGKLRARDSHREGNDCGASVGTRLTLAAGEKRTLSIVLSWYTPEFNIWKKDHEALVSTWYATRYKSHDAMNSYLLNNLDNIRQRTLQFATAIHNNDMPAEFISAVTRNLAIFKSPSFVRAEDGKLWGWEGCHDNSGCCHGSCTHVYNYAQALAFLFPQLERGMRDVEFGPSQEEDGYQHFRANLPFDNPFEHRFHAAADGQLGGIIRIYRDWIISGESTWLKEKWPRIKQSLEYCINVWDLDRNGRLAEPHHNTYDVEFWGEDGLCSTIYAGALQAAIAMAEFLGESSEDWANILQGVQAVIKDELFDGWIRQKVHWKDLKADDPTAVSIGSKQNSPEADAIIEKEGPRYQYGEGVLIDAALGCQNARMAGLGAVIDEDIERAHVDAIMEHNYKDSLADHACFQRPGYGIASEAGTIMCSWPDGGRLSMPFPYSDEVWTGCEHQFASHLVLLGRLDDAIKVEAAVNGRYTGKIRNPFNEIECGHFYIRALASYALVPAFSGAQYNAVTQTMRLQPSIEGDFISFFAIGSAWGYIGVKNGAPFLDLIEGELAIENWDYIPYGANVVTA